MTKHALAGGNVVLLVSFALYVLFAFFVSADSAKFAYVRIIFVMLVACTFLIFRPAPLMFRKNLILLGSTVFVAGYVLISPVSKSHIYVLLFYLNIVVFAVYFSNVYISDREFIGGVNLLYIVYLMISIVLWAGLLPNANVNEDLIKEEFRVSFGFISYYVMPGIEGSPSYVDSFSGLILLLNLFIRSGQRLRKTAAILSVVGLALSLRMTPIVSIFVLLLASPIIRNRALFLAFHFAAFSSFLALIIMVHHKVVLNFFGLSVDVSLIAYLATHARSMIWEQQIMVLLTDYEWYDFLFGGFDMERFRIPSYQLTGEATGRDLSNPHSSYLLILFRSPLLAFGLAVVSIVAFATSLRKEYFISVSFILLACYTNSSIISLGNPVYLYVIMQALASGRRGLVPAAEESERKGGRVYSSCCT